MPKKQRLVIEAQLDNLSTVRRFIEESCRILGARDSVISDLRLAVDEAVTNIIIHGYEKRGGNIEAEVERKDDALVVRLRDDAAVFDPATRFTPESQVPRGLESPGKLGIHLIQKAIDDISHRITESGGNELTLVKRNGDIFQG
jgi:anti-sigma regulatory factor (Ser/Thr protein kinase)